MEQLEKRQMDETKVLVYFLLPTLTKFMAELLRELTELRNVGASACAIVWTRVNFNIQCAQRRPSYKVTTAFFCVVAFTT